MPINTNDKTADVNVFVRISTDHELELFTDEAGSVRMTNDAPVVVSISKHGEIGFRFIRNHNPGHHGANIETADLIVIPQDRNDNTRPSKRKKDTPFDKTAHKEWVLFLPDPAPATDPGNLNGSLQPPTGSLSIPAGKGKLRADGVNNTYKYTICALSDDGTWFDAVDPTIKIEP